MYYDAFISYSHAADGMFAPRMQTALLRLGKPWYRRRALSVFRDETGLNANPGLWTSIADALTASEWFILLASPQAAQSQWVEREVAAWKEHRGVGRMLVVLTEGNIEWNDRAGDFDWATTDALPPSLRGSFAEEPRFIDMRWVHDELGLDLRNGRFRDQIAEIAAPLHGVAKEELEGEDIRNHRRAMTLAWAASFALFVMFIASLVGFVLAARNANEATQSSANATEQARVASSERDRADQEAARAIASAATAQANADEADRQKAEAQLQRRTADSNAASSSENARRADENAAEAEVRRMEAENNAALAASNQQEADQNAALSEQNAAEARANAEEATFQEEEAQRNATRAGVAQQAAEAASSELADANVSLAATNDALTTANEQTSTANANLLQANGELSAANTRIDAERIAALAMALTETQPDTAMLLAAEAGARAPDDLEVRAALGQIVANRTQGLVRTLDAPTSSVLATDSQLEISDDGTRLAVTQAPASSTDTDLTVWDLTTASTAPVRLRIAGRIEKIRWTAGSTLLAVVHDTTAGDTRRVIGIDTVAQQETWTTPSSPNASMYLSRDRTHVAVQLFDAVDPDNTSVIELRRTATGALVERRAGILYAQAHDGEVGHRRSLEQVGNEGFDATGTRLLAYYFGLDEWVLVDISTPSSITTISTGAAQTHLPELDPTGAFVASVDATGVRVIDARTGDTTGSIDLTTATILNIAPLAGGRSVALVETGQLTILDMDDGTTRVFAIDPCIVDAAPSTTGAKLVLTSSRFSCGDAVQIVNIASGSVSQLIPGRYVAMGSTRFAGFDVPEDRVYLHDSGGRLSIFSLSGRQYVRVDSTVTRGSLYQVGDTMVATASGTPATATFWPTDGGAERTLPGLPHLVRFRPGTSMVVTWDEEGSLFLWDLSMPGAGEAIAPVGSGPVAVAPDGSRVAVATGSSLDITALDTHSVTTVPLGPDEEVHAIQFVTPTMLVVGIGSDTDPGAVGTTLMIKLQTGPPAVARVAGDARSWTPDGTRLVLRTDVNEIQIVDGMTMLALSKFGVPEDPTFAAISPDGNTVVTRHGTVLESRTIGGTVTATSDVPSWQPVAATFTVGGELLVVRDGPALRRLERLTAALIPVAEVDLSADSRLGAFLVDDQRDLLRVATDGGVVVAAGQVLELSSLRTVGHLLPVAPAGTSVRSVAAADEGRVYAVVDGNVRRLDTTSSPLVATACAKVGRTLTAAEWATAFGTATFGPACTG